MKLSEFKKQPSAAKSGPAAPPEPVSEASLQEPEEPQGVTSVTPSGIEIAYEWAPRRLYRLNGDEVPSVTTVLGVLDKSGPLTWWGMKVGIEGCLEVQRRGLLESTGMPVDDVVGLLTEHKLTVNHVKDKAADRGVNVHGALERWTEVGPPSPSDWPEAERGYVQGLSDFLCAVEPHASEPEFELMVGSLEHQYAGRFDLVLELDAPTEVVTRCYPKRPPKVETIPAGRYLMDLKTRKKASVYDTNFLQLEAYEHAAVECGYRPTDYRAVIVVTEDGGYQLSVNKDFCFQDFLAVRACYQVMNEREVLRVLREELDAQEVK